MSRIFTIVLWTIPLMCSCEKYYVNVTRVDINKTSLASVFAMTPDPRLASPPKGEELVIEWNLSSKEEHQQLFLDLFVIYKDYSEEMIRYTLDSPRGIISYFLLGEQYQRKQGIMTYKVEIKTEKGEMVKQWQQNLWIKVIPLELEL